MENKMIKELTLDDLSPDLLQHFNRYQEVKRCWRFEDGEWVLKDISYTHQWDENTKKNIATEGFTDYINSGGFVWGVFNDNNQLIAFATLLSDFFGSENQYIQLSLLHVSCGYRNQGIGRQLFKLCAEKAKSIGAKKLYISTNPSEESQIFYKNVGCVDAEEINQKLAENEPLDRQLEFVL